MAQHPLEPSRPMHAALSFQAIFIPLGNYRPIWRNLSNFVCPFDELPYPFALLETGVGIVNALNERIGEAVRRGGTDPLPLLARLAISAALLVCAFLAARLGLVALIAGGYGAFGYIVLAVFVLLLLTPRLLRRAEHAERIFQPHFPGEWA